MAAAAAREAVLHLTVDASSRKSSGSSSAAAGAAQGPLEGPPPGKAARKETPSFQASEGM